MSYTIQDFGPDDLLTSPVEGNRRVKVGLDPRHRDPFHQLLTVEYTPIVERKPLPGLSAIRDRVVGGTASVVNGEIVIDGSLQKTALYTLDRGRYLPGLYGIAGIGVRADWSTGAFEYGYGDDDGNRVGVEWAAGVPYTFVESLGSRYYRKPRSEWLDPLDGTGPSKQVADLSQHVLRIKIGWYGYLRVEYYISVGSRDEGDQLILVDRADLPNGVSFEQPDLPVFAEVNGGTLYVGGRQFGVYGRYSPEYRITSAFGDKDAIGTTGLVPVISMQHKDTSNWLGVPAKLAGLTVLSTANAQIAVIVGGTLTGAVWGSIDGIDDTETALRGDTSATAITGGYRAFGDYVAGGAGRQYGSQSSDIPDVEIPPGVIITLAIVASSGTTDVQTAIRIKEEW